MCQQIKFIQYEGPYDVCDFKGFRKNDIITIVSQRDEHCWVGEINGLTGWFPAKLVQVLDERRYANNFKSIQLFKIMSIFMF